MYVCLQKRTLSCILLIVITLLTSEYIKAKELNLASIDWPPYTGEFLYKDGLLSQIVTEVFAIDGYVITYDYQPWARALFHAKVGKNDGVMTAYWKPEREEYLTYPDPIIEITEWFFFDHQNPLRFKGDLNAMASKTVAALAGSAQAKELLLAGVEVLPVSSHRQSIKLLLAKRVDAIVIPEPVFRHYILELGLTEDMYKFQRSAFPFKSYPVYVAFSKQRSDSQNLAKIFNRGLQIYKRSDQYKEILARYGVIQTVGAY